VTGYWLEGSGSIHGRSKSFSPLHRVQRGSGAKAGSYKMGTVESYPGVKVAGT
jgi:hypothetical protein